MTDDEDLRRQINDLRDRIDTSDDIADADRNVLHEFDSRISPLVPQDLGLYRHRKLLRDLILIAERHGDLAASLEDRDATEAIKRFIDEEWPNEETNRDKRSVLYRFGAEMADGDGPPESIAWLPTTYSSTHDATPDPRDILLWDDDVVPMLQAAQNPRDRAMVALQFDAGLRGGEFKALEYRDIQDHDHGLQVTVEGKQGRRTVLLVKSVEAVSTWLSEHPGQQNGDPLWTKLGRADTVSDRLIYDAFGRLADRADVSKPVTLTNFRKSSAAFLARRNVSQAHIEDHHGWVRGSKAASRYIQVFGEDTDREIARVHGIDVSDDELSRPADRECPRCGDVVEAHRDFCGSCNQALDQEAAQVVDRVLGILDDRLVAAEDADTRRQIMSARQDITSDPGSKDIDDLHELVSSVDSSD